MTTVGSIRAELILESENYKRGVEQSRKKTQELTDEFRRLKTGVSEAGASLNRTASGATSSLKQMSEGHRRAGADASRHAGELNSLGDIAAAAFVAITFGLVQATREAAAFEQQLANLASVTTLTSEQLERAKNAAQDFGPDYGIAPDIAAQSLTEFVKAGIDAERLIAGELKDAFALQVAGELSVAEAAAFASTAINTYRDENLNLARVADIAAGSANASATSVREMGEANRQLGPVAAQMGATFEEVNATLAIFANNGLRGSIGPFAT